MKTARRPNAKRRQGIVLILVVSLLALFILLGISFALVAAAHYSAAKVDREIQRVGDMPETEVDLVLQQIICDSLVHRSSLQGHSLLADLYGGDGIGDGITMVGQVATAPTNYDTQPSNNNVKQGQILTFTAAGNSIYQTRSNNAPHYFAGRVMTFTGGIAANHSTRIIDSQPATNNRHTFAIEAIESKTVDYATGLPFLVPRINDPFIINGAPFNGAGAGYDDVSRTVGAVLANMQAATNNTINGNDLVSLLPHLNGYDGNNCRIYMSDGTTTTSYPPLPQFFYRGGPDESWDAVDIQNMFLAMVPPRAAEVYASGGGLPIIPSYHRPELVNYWLLNYLQQLVQSVNGVQQQFQVIAQPYGPDGVRGSGDENTSVSADDLDRIYNITRGCIFRPMPWDHPGFTGSNNAFVGTFQANATNPQTFDITNGLGLFQALINSGNLPIWDVDNDNDGVPDSIWIDPGLPVMTSPDGHRYKRLASILIKDLDGSVNLNAHGNLAQVNAGTTTDPYPYRATSALSAAAGLAPIGAMLPRGLGFGPAEVDFLHFFGTDYQAYQRVMYYRYSSTQTGDLLPGIPNSRDGLSIVKHFGVPTDYGNQVTPVVSTANWYTEPSWYASPPDVWGRGAVALDYGGQPFFKYMGELNETVDTPYELSLSGQPSNADSPFTAVELERLLRYHDSDAQNLPCRLLAPGIPGGNYFGGNVLGERPGEIGNSHRLRNMVTVASSDVPAHTARVPQQLRSNTFYQNIPMGGGTIVDLYRARLSAPVMAGGGGLTDPELTGELNRMVPFEFFQGKNFDINRWLGNGIDDNVNANSTARDEAVEGANGESAWQLSAIDTTLNSLPAYFRNPLVPAQHTNSVDMNGDGVVNAADNQYARQLYARHLFCLAMLFLPDQFSLNPINPMPPPFPKCPQETNLSDADYKKLIIRRIAQWAVNCVDFRDSDSIMTPFEFDYEPFRDNDSTIPGTWEVDGYIGAKPGPDNKLDTMDDVPSNDDQAQHRGLVWGMEYPDLLISETLAFHDRRVKDTDKDDGAGGDTPRKKVEEMNMPDADLDQFRIPQGSLFIELWNARANLWTGVMPPQTANQKPLLPTELYDTNGLLQLGRKVQSADGVDRPIWRLAITGLINANNNAQHMPKMPHRMYVPSDPMANNESASFDPLNVNLVPGGTPNGVLPIERYVWFTDTTGVPAAEKYNIFSSIRNSTPTVQPGGYVVVGPRPTTYLGSYNDASMSKPMGANQSLGEWGGNSPQYIDLSAFNVHDLTSNMTVANIQPVSTIIAEQYFPWAQTSNYRIGLNITEPLAYDMTYALSPSYYPQPQIPPLTGAAAISLPAGELKDSFYDNPDTNVAAGQFPDVPFDSDPSRNSPLRQAGMIRSQTYPQVASVFLQRLADPTQGFHPLRNPYITMDWASIDVSVFSGEEDTNRQVPSGTANTMTDIDTSDPPAAGMPPTRSYQFRTRQRGTQTPSNNPWPPLSYLPAAAVAATGSPNDIYFNFSINNTAPGHTLGYLNSTIDAAPSNANYPGEPANPFPWLTWHNRPFSNPMELLLVPSSSQSRLCTEITPGFQFLGMDVYGEERVNQGGFRSPFGHLLNFFQTENPYAGTGLPGPPPPPPVAPHLYDILDFVEVPSPYQGAERWYNPQHLGANGIYRPPFNKVSRFRDPGKININTIFDADVWKAAVGLHPHLSDINGVMWNKMTHSRSGRGGAPGVNSWLQMDPSMPTLFGNPFRSADSADLMPPLPAMRKLKTVEATFLRSDPDPARPNMPLFQPDYATEWQEPFRNVQRNPYFLNSDLQKMGNIFTTHSNCFAVWITIGYFEVSENRPIQNGPMVIDAAHPDGLTLGQELGLDTGGVTRHRAFYIIDRSIPVGFLPGSRLNSDDCILTRRLIE